MVFTVNMEGLEFQMRTKFTCKIAKLWYLLVHSGEEMIFINQLECQKHHFARLASRHIGLASLHAHNSYALCTIWIQVCYVAFWDEVTRAAQESEGHNIGDDGFIGKWRIVVVKDLPFTDQRLNGKIPKV